ncbi:hypothetical protein AAZX31_04G002900 [Glycine max]
MAECTSTPTNSSLRLTAKVAIVTGGASGIGEATARVFAEQGARMVVIADIQDDLVNRVAASIGTHRCTYVHCDVADEEQVKYLVQTTVNAYGQIDIMFRNAGIASPSKQTVSELDMSQQLFAGRVRGSIICTASVVGSHGEPNATNYIMSKHAVLGLMRSASVQLAEHGIRVNCVSPNGLATPLTFRETGRSGSHAQRRGRHRVVVSDDSAFITGFDLIVDGGFKYGQ